jgi:SAM-dependent methyltransferase
MPKLKTMSSPSQAELADRHQLYEASVQDPESELEFVAETFAERVGRPLKLLREDFCGTAHTAAHWVTLDPSHRAIGIDLDAEVLNWGRQHHIGALTPAQQARIELIEGNVLTASAPPADAILGMNFSYYLFKTRDQLREYFQRAHANLVNDGVLFLDAFGGYEAHREIEERTEHDGFTYVWDQAKFDPITHDMTCMIHFEFDDDSEMKAAFTYHWRLWTLPEIKELLLEAGFARATIYWEGTDEESNEGNGIYSPAEHGEADAGWISYLVAEKRAD